MFKRKLGTTDLEVTQLGYGSMGLRGPATWGVRVVSDSAAARFLNQVLDAGVNFIDTSPDYGRAEQRIGDSIGHRRSEYFLATKCGCAYTQHEDHLELDHIWEPDVVRRNLETSLQRLRTDWIDILQFHGGDAKTLCQRGLIDLLQAFKREGKIRYLGVSSKLPELQALLDLNVFDTFQIPYSCLAPDHDEAMRSAVNAGAGVILRGGIAQGGPDAEIQRPALNTIWTAAGLDELLDESLSRAELILRATLSHPACHTTIVGTCNPQHFAENLAAAARGPLPADLLDELQRRVRQALSALN